MRLSVHEVEAIVRTVRARLGDDARIVLFGSRTRDETRGGDVDLYVESATPVQVLDELRLAEELQRVLDLPVDLVLSAPDLPEQPIHRIARATGVLLG